MNSKTALRDKAKNIRKQLDLIEISNKLVKEIQATEYYAKAKNVLLFYPMKFEVNLLKLLDDDKKFYLPKMHGNDLFICPFAKGDELISSDFNVQEPCSNPVNPEILDLIIVPALMVDKKNYRLGYGGGFYDRFLSRWNNITTVSAIARELVVEELPHEEFDMPVDYIIAM